MIFKKGRSCHRENSFFGIKSTNEKIPILDDNIVEVLLTYTDYIAHHIHRELSTTILHPHEVYS